MTVSLRIETPLVADGRIARGLRTRESILRAYEEWVVDAPRPPTGAELAARAGVSARSIFTHFGDMDGVLAAAARRAFEWFVETHEDIPRELPVDERLRRFAARFAEVLERTAPLYRMLRSFRQGTRRAEESPAVMEVLSGVDQLRRGYIDFVFGAELNVLPPGVRYELVEALVVASSWNTWEGLRGEQSLDMDVAQAVMTRTLRGLLPGA
jgi:AcrR family transcriptional regulator